MKISFSLIYFHYNIVISNPDSIQSNSNPKPYVYGKRILHLVS